MELRKYFTELVPVNEAIKRITENVMINLNTEEVTLEDSLGMIAGEDIESPYDLPNFNRAVVDGYAVRAEDTYGASQSSPIELKVIGRVDVGTNRERIPEVGPGEAVEIATGAPIPKGANAVVMYEDTERVSEEKVLIYKSLAAWTNVSRVGEDFEKGVPIIRRGDVIRPWHIGTLASYGFSKVRVLRALRIAVIPIGNEVVPPSRPEPLPWGKVYDSTSYLITSYLNMNRYINAVRYDPVPDEERLIERILGNALSESDMILTIGGSSVGNKDLTYRAVLKLGNAKVLFRGVAIRPGKPATALTVNGKLVFIASGFPVAALAEVDLILLPALKKILRVRDIDTPTVKAKLVRRLVNVTGYTSYARVRVFRCDTTLCVEPLRVTGSGVLATLIKGNGVVIIPPDVEGYEYGAYVNVKLVNPIE